jgi:hypothetical protein
MEHAAELTAEDVARALRCHVRTARRWCAAWLAASSKRPGVPRVRFGRTGRRGHPPYVVDAASLQAWLRGAPASNLDAPTANDAN